LSSPPILSAIQRLFSLLTRQEKFKWAGIVGFVLCTSVLEVITASVIVVFAQVLNQPEAGKVYMLKLGFEESLSAGRTIFVIAIIFGVIYLIKNLVAAAEIFYQNFTIQRMSYHFKNKLLHRFSETDYNFHLTRNSSYGMAVIGSDAELIFSNGMVSLSTIFSEAVVFLCLNFMVIYLNPSLAFFIFALVVGIAVFVTKYLFPLFYLWGQKLQEVSELANQNLLQFFHSFKEMILLGKKEAFIESYQTHSYHKSKILATQTATNALPRMIIEVLFAGVFVTVISYLCLEHDTPKQMIGILGGYLYLGFRLMPGLNRIISQLNTFKSTIPSIERIYKESTSQTKQVVYRDIPELIFKKNLSFKNVSFGYLNVKKKALKDINLVIGKGECIGIVGETGSGKSTLVDLMLGLLHPTSGEILVDEKYPVCSRQWHHLIGYVPQSIYLTDDTIEANIAFGENIAFIDPQRLTQALADAQLQSLVDKLPAGVKTLVGERGIRLSGGERQRIAIARALYRNPEVLIFDEATSALDNETESRLMETIYTVSKHRTVIMIAHRLTTLKNCDRIVTMYRGELKNIMTNEDFNNTMNSPR
jgi:ABC-type multidrug transport system fused ATPase/permease subunit